MVAVSVLAAGILAGPAFALAGNVVELASQCTAPAGQVDGSAASARFDAPGRIASNASGKVAILEDRVGLWGGLLFWSSVRVLEGGSVSTVIGLSEQLGPYRDVEVAADGAVFVANEFSVTRIANGVATLFAGSTSPGGQDGPLGVGKFATIVAMEFRPSGSLIVLERQNSTSYRVRSVSTAGVISTLKSLTVPVQAGPTPAYRDIAVDGSSSIYVLLDKIQLGAQVYRLASIGYNPVAVGPSMGRLSLAVKGSGSSAVITTGDDGIITRWSALMFGGPAYIGVGAGGCQNGSDVNARMGMVTGVDELPDGRLAFADGNHVIRAWES